MKYRIYWWRYNYKFCTS